MLSHLPFFQLKSARLSDRSRDWRHSSLGTHHPSPFELEAITSLPMLTLDHRPRLELRCDSICWHFRRRVVQLKSGAVLVVLENVMEREGPVLLVCISMYYPSQLLSITWVSSRRLSSFRNFLMDFPGHLRLRTKSLRGAKRIRLASRGH